MKTITEQLEFEFWPVKQTHVLRLNDRTSVVQITERKHKAIFEMRFNDGHIGEKGIIRWWAELLNECVKRYRPEDLEVDLIGVTQLLTRRDAEAIKLFVETFRP